MTEIIERIVRINNLGLDAGWKVIEWCEKNGGDEFSFNMLCSGEENPALGGRIKAALEAFHPRTREREALTTLAGQKKRRPVSTWRLGPEVISMLRREVPEGFFAEPAHSNAGWLEDFTIFRRGQIMLGVVSHEGCAVLRLTGKEHDELPELKPASGKRL